MDQLSLFLLKKKSEGKLPITNTEMTRFNISLDEAVSMVLYALKNALGGEIFIPKIPSYNIEDLAKAICPKCEKKVVGIRPGEKIHEEMISASDSHTTYDIGKFYVILPPKPTWNLDLFLKKFNAKKVDSGFTYNSKSNQDRLNVNQIRKLIKKHVDTNFSLSI